MDNLEQVSYRTYKHILAAKKEGVITQEEIDEVLADNKITGYEATKLFKKARDRRLTRQHKILREIE